MPSKLLLRVAVVFGHLPNEREQLVPSRKSLPALFVGVDRKGLSALASAVNQDLAIIEFRDSLKPRADRLHQLGVATKGDLDCGHERLSA